MQSYTDINRAATKKKNNRKIYVRDKLLSFNKDQLRDLKIYTSRSVNNFLQTLLSQLIARFFISYLLVTYLHLLYTYWETLTKKLGRKFSYAN